MASLDEIYEKLEKERLKRLEEKRLQEQLLFEEYEKQRQFMMNDRHLFLENIEKATRGNARITQIVLQFDDINNALLLTGITDYNSLSDWNNFFDLPTFGTPFTFINVDETNNIVVLTTELTVVLKPLLFNGFTHLKTIKTII